MKKTQLTTQDLAGIANFYRLEHAATLAKLRYLESMLEKLNDAPASAQLPAEKTVDLTSEKSKSSPAVKATPEVKLTKKDAVKASKPPVDKGKPGRKSHWTPWIMKMIYASKRPYTAQGIIDVAAKEFKINPANRQKLVQNINAHIYRLRHTKQLVSAKIPGQTFKFLTPPEWLGANNRVKPEFVANLK